MEALRFIYSTLLQERNKKERFDMILEPLQAIIQLALLSVYPTGTKLSILNNILHIQEPGWNQGVVRSYYYDTKDDLIYLFSVIKRFHQFYIFLKTNTNKNYNELFELLITMCKKGLDKLIQTYSKSDHGNLTQTLKMYKSLLDTPGAFTINNKDTDDNNIDNIFIKITTLYDKSHFIIILNMLKLLNKDVNNYREYSNSLYYLTKPTNIKIKKWISDNIVF
jgi:hypothetical protein